MSSGRTPHLRVFVMRHGPAEPDSHSGRDFDRALSPEGRIQTLAVARALVESAAVLDRIATSPLVRTRQTAELVASLFPAPPPIMIHDGLAPGEDLGRVVDECLGAGAESLLIVAHAPDVSILAGTLLQSRVSSFEPAMIVGIDHDGIAGREFLRLRPSSLAS